MIRQQRWTPDTCFGVAQNQGCVLIEEWDDSQPEVSRTHTPVQVERVCAFHAALQGLGVSAVYNRALDENRRKNTTWSIAQSVKAQLLIEQMQWSYDANGLLTVQFGTNLTNQQKTQLQNVANVQFGVGKVVIL